MGSQSFQLKQMKILKHGAPMLWYIFYKGMKDKTLRPFSHSVGNYNI